MLAHIKRDHYASSVAADEELARKYTFASSPVAQIASPSDYPFCDTWSVKLSERRKHLPGLDPHVAPTVPMRTFMRHISKYQIQLALFVLPKGVGSDQVVEDTELSRESDESSVSGEETHTNLEHLGVGRISASSPTPSHPGPIICRDIDSIPPGRQIAAILQCGMCMAPRMYSRKADLKRDMETHLPPTHFCYVENCPRGPGNGFQRVDKLNEHRQKIHGLQPSSLIEH